MAPSPGNQADNPLLGSIYMMLAMAGYVVNDSLLKLVSADLPLSTILVVRGGFAIVLILLMAIVSGSWRHWRSIWSKPVFMRATFDTLATFLFLTALFQLSIAIATAILQTVPLVVMLFGAIFLKERIGWRRILAIIIGFIGVLLVVQPGTSGFNSYVFLLFGVVILVAVRDTTTRNLPTNTPSLLVTLANVLMVTSFGAIYMQFQQVPAITNQHLSILALASVFLVAATMFVILTMRAAEISTTAPFRYSAILWSLISAYVIFNETPNFLAVVGIMMIATAGLYSLFRTTRTASR